LCVGWSGLTGRPRCGWDTWRPRISRRGRQERP